MSGLPSAALGKVSQSGSACPQLGYPNRALAVCHVVVCFLSGTRQKNLLAVCTHGEDITHGKESLCRVFWLTVKYKIVVCFFLVHDKLVCLSSVYFLALGVYFLALGKQGICRVLEKKKHSVKRNSKLILKRSINSN